MDNIINKLYENMINIVIKDIEPKYIDAVSKQYMNKLVQRYSNIKIDLSNVDYVYNNLFEREYKEWSKMPSGFKKQMFLKDENLNKIIDISSIAYEYAKDRKMNNTVISKELADEYSLKLEELLKTVEEFNINLAKWYVSESMMDLSFASNQTDSMSMRISHIG